MPASAAGPRSAAKAAGFFALALVCCAAQPGFAAADDDPLAIEFVPPAASPPLGRAEGERWAIYFSGRIDDRAAERFREELARREIQSASVYLNSRGGDLSQGMELGGLIRERGFSTSVGRQNDRGSIPFAGECYSACVLAFIGGTYRFYAPRSRIGVHRFSVVSPADSDADTAQIVSAAVVNYIRDMQVDVGLFDRMSRVGKEQILILGKLDLEQLRVINDGRLPAEWAIDTLNGASYLRGAQQTWQGTGTILLSCSEGNVLFQPMFETSDQLVIAADSVTQHLIKFGNGYLPLADPLQPISLQDGRLSAQFVLDAQQLRSLRNAPSVGYSAKLRNPVATAGFSVDTAGPGAKTISAFLKGCER